MSPRLVFPDSRSAADVLTYCARTSSLGDGAVRLRAAAGVLAISSAPLAPRGLFDATPTILGMRTVAIDPELECDLVVPASALVAAADDDTALVLPETAVTASWAGVSPPRAGWTESAGLAASTLAARAQWGIAAVAEAMPQNPGEDVVRSVRASVWGVADEALGGLPLGVAFAAFALGFVAGEEEARVRVAPAWTRVSLHRGHVLVRGPVRTGLTAVRPTGAA
ncbi:hypothetical protein [Microbacterium aureliae]